LSYCRSLGNSGNRDGCCIQAAPIHVSGGPYTTLPYTHYSSYLYTILTVVNCTWSNLIQGICPPSHFKIIIKTY